MGKMRRPPEIPEAVRRAARKRWLVTVLLAFAVAALAVPSIAFGIASIGDARPGLGDRDYRSGAVAPTFDQIQAASDLGASVRWDRFGTPRSLVKPGGFLATGVAGASAVEAARNWLAAHTALFGLASTDGLALYADSKMAQTTGHAVSFRQQVGGLTAQHDGLVTVGVVGSAANGWKVASASSSLTRDTTLTGTARLSAAEAWNRAAANVGRSVSLVGIHSARNDGEWRTFHVEGFADVERARLVALPTYVNGVRPAFESLVLDNQDGGLTGYRIFVDADNGDVLLRENLVEQSHPTAATFTGAVPPVDGACDIDQIPGGWTITPSEAGTVGSIDVVAGGALAANDAVIHLIRNGSIVASQDTATSPEAIHYAPATGVPTGTYQVRVCDFGDGAAWTAPTTTFGSIVFNPVSAGGLPYPPKWKVFPAYPTPPALAGYPWNLPSTDIRKVWCWDSVVQGNPVPGCQDQVSNLAARIPWDSINSGQPTFTTVGNAANDSEAWFNPLAPGPTGFRPQDANRNYSFPWTMEWSTSTLNPTQPGGCSSSFTPGVSSDISAAVTNLFGMHNRMHDWSYFLGFTEENWNGQLSNFGNGGSENDPVLGQSQAGAANGGWPNYLGRDNANMRTLPDGVSSITNMYLFQPLRAAFYSPCVDGDYDMTVIGHEYSHMTENRMIGKGSNRSGDHAGAMGESNADLNAMEVLNEFGFLPVNGEGRYVIGAYATGNKVRGIRDYALDANPLNFSDIGFDTPGPEVHADGEIWNAVNFDIRQALINKYNASYPASNATLQRKCADGQGNPTPAPSAPENCPGNRRWIQLVYDAYLLMPTAPSMLDARDAMLAADLMRNAADPAWPSNQTEIWNAFARRGFGTGASSSNAFVNSDTDPKPDFASPLASNATVNFSVFAPDESNTPITNARIFVGQYEARVSPVADTDPSTNTTGTNNLDDQAQFAPGTYDFVVRAPGYGLLRFTRTFTAGQTVTLNIAMPTNWASSAKGATASGDGTDQGNLIDDTEATDWEFTGGPVGGRQVTVALNGLKTINRVQVSALINPGQNRFTALRSFRIQTCSSNCSLPTSFTTRLTSAADAFPGASPRPVAPNMILRSFSLSSPVSATHVRLVVVANQCTGNPDFQGVQDNDLLNPTDCAGQGEPAGTDPGDLAGQFIPTEQGTTVHAAELQVFGSAGGASTGGSTLTLTPQSAMNTVGTQHCVTATLRDSSGNPIRNATIRFSVSPPNATSGSGTTNNSGQATFCYTGTNTGTDTITAYADLNRDGVQQGTEPSDAATKTWNPPSTPNCAVDVNNGGQITTDAGDRATFGGHARVSGTGVASGNEQYQDHGPAMPLNVKALNVQSVVCPGAGEALISGQASVDGSGSVDYQIHVRDAGEPGTSDKYGIKLTVGTTTVYDSGYHTLESGNVQIH
jgi:extracellular elastinolytic metalloproteinase